MTSQARESGRQWWQFLLSPRNGRLRRLLRRHEVHRLQTDGYEAAITFVTGGGGGASEPVLNRDAFAYRQPIAYRRIANRELTSPDGWRGITTAERLEEVSGSLADVSGPAVGVDPGFIHPMFATSVNVNDELRARLRGEDGAREVVKQLLETDAFALHEEQLNRRTRQRKWRRKEKEWRRRWGLEQFFSDLPSRRQASAEGALERTALLADNWSAVEGYAMDDSFMRRWRFTRYRARQQHVRRAARDLVRYGQKGAGNDGEKKRVRVVVGDALLKPTVRKHSTGPLRAYIRVLAFERPDAVVVLMNEYNTSARCPLCGEKLRQGQRPGREWLTGQVVPKRRCRRCSQCFGDGDGWDNLALHRDKAASARILTNYLLLIEYGEIPPPWRPPATWPESGRQSVSREHPAQRRGARPR